MAQTFGHYSPAVPLATTWRETITLYEDEAETQPLDISGLAARAQLRIALPAIANNVVPDPLIEFTTPDYYDVAPAWPVREAFDISQGNLGKLFLTVLREDFADVVSPTNAKAKLYWEIILVNKDSGDSTPVVDGKVVFLPANTI